MMNGATQRLFWQDLVSISVCEHSGELPYQVLQHKKRKRKLKKLMHGSVGCSFSLSISIQYKHSSPTHLLNREGGGVSKANHSSTISTPPSPSLHKKHPVLPNPSIYYRQAGRQAPYFTLFYSRSATGVAIPALQGPSHRGGLGLLGVWVGR